MTVGRKQGLEKRKSSSKDDDERGRPDKPRKRNRAPNIDYSQMLTAKQLAFQRSRVRRYGALAREWQNYEGAREARE